MKRRFAMKRSRFMERRFLSVLLALSMCFCVLPAGVRAEEEDNYEQTSYSGGSGTQNDPYLISSRDDLEALANAVNDGDDQAGVWFSQTRDIELGGKENLWPTIGITIDNAAHQFNGVYDGNQNKITGLYVDRHNDDAGLFGYIGANGVVTGVNVEQGEVYGTYWCGGVAGRNYGVIEYSSFSGYVYGSQQFVGGIVGDNHSGGIVRYCYNTGDVEGNQMVGGIVGRNSSSTVENCYNRGDVYSNNGVRGYVGGIVGENTASSTVDNCYSTGYVEGRMAAGALVGANGAGSSVEHCYWEDSEGTGLPGVDSSQGTVNNVEEKTSEQFDSGEVAWELSKGTNGEGWGQTLKGDNDEHDEHPHFTKVPDKPYETTEVYRVTFTTKTTIPPINVVLYVDPGTNVDLPGIPPNTEWYMVDKNGSPIVDENGELVIFDGKDVNSDIDAIAGTRSLFAGETGTITENIIYSTEEQTVNLDTYMEYENGIPSSQGRFEYSITEDKDGLGAAAADDGRLITIPAKTSVKEGGYTLSVTAHEKEPAIRPLALGKFGTEDVTLTVNVVIEKATPVIVTKPEASDIGYGQTLGNSILTGGEAQHPVTGAIVSGIFTWEKDDSVPAAIAEAAAVGYSVTFTPDDTVNYNSVTTLVTLTVNKIDIDPSGVIAPAAADLVYNGSAQNLLSEAGSAEGGTMKYWLGDDAEYSSTVPSRANAGEYTVWYKVVGDENHNDTEPQPLTAIIRPATIDIDPVNVTYNGSSSFTITLDGVILADGSAETVVASLNPYSRNAASYEYSDAEGDGKYTAELSSTNYTVGTARTLTIDPLPAVLQWSDPLTFTYDGGSKQVNATVSNAIDGDQFRLTYRNDIESQEGEYTAEVTDLGNNNYTLENAQNVTQKWYILAESENVALFDAVPVTYGDNLTLTVSISPIDDASGVSLMALAPGALDQVEFCVNGVPLGSVNVIYNDDNRNSATVTFNTDAISIKNFSAGANAVTAEYSGSANVSGGKAAITVIVNAKPITADITGDETARTKSYDGNDAAAGLDIELNGVVDCDRAYVTAAAETYTYNSPDVTDASYITANNITLSGAQSGNYVLDTNVTATGRINPKPAGLEWRGSTGLVYTGNPVNVNATAIELIPGDECEVTVENGDQTNAGTYTAKAVSLSNPDYTLDTLPDTVTNREYTIDPAALYIQEKTVTYSGTKEFDEEEDGVTPDNGITEKVSVRLTASSADVGSYDYSETLGEGRYTADMVENGNYKIANGATLTIQKADPTFTPPTARKLEYNGTEQELIEAGSAEGGTMEYSLSENGEYSAAIPTGIEEGTYTVWYRVTGDSNHNDIAPRSLNVTISKAGSEDTGGSGKPTGPTRPGNPTGPGNPNGSSGAGSSTDASDRNGSGDNGDSADGNDYTDVSSGAAAYEAGDKIGTVSANAFYTNIIATVSVIAAVAFILKKKYSGQKDRR